jgi:hypothetical protein
MPARQKPKRGADDDAQNQSNLRGLMRAAHPFLANWLTVSC